MLLKTFFLQRNSKNTGKNRGNSVRRSQAQPFRATGVWGVFGGFVCLVLFVWGFLDFCLGFVCVCGFYFWWFFLVFVVFFFASQYKFTKQTIY